MKCNIVIVDDHLLIAKAIANIISDNSNHRVLYEVANGKLLQEKFQNKKNIPDIILLDISMPVMDGFETMQWLKANHPEVHVMVLSMQDDDQSLIRMIKYGARGYLLKNINTQELLDSIDKIVKHGVYFPEWVSSKVLLNMNEADALQKITANFSDRELEFIKYTVTEMSYKDIAEKMFVSPRTVEGYRDSLFQKLDLRTRVGLAMFAVKHRLAEL
jgi:DNA-binding NarL/FixJ family response regulator